MSFINILIPFYSLKASLNEKGKKADTEEKITFDASFKDPT